MKVRPKKGLRVAYERRPRQYIPAEGASVPSTTYYHRRLRDGDLELVEEKPEPEPVPEPLPEPEAPRSPRRRRKSVSED